MCGQLLLLSTTLLLALFASAIWYQPQLFWSKLLSRVHFPHFHRRIGRILLIPPKALCFFRLQQLRCAAAETWGRSHHHYSRNPLHLMWLPPWPWNTSMEAFMPPPATGRLAGVPNCPFHSYWRGCAGRCAEEALHAAPHQPLGSREPWCSPGHMQQDSFCLQRAEKR